MDSLLRSALYSSYIGSYRIGVYGPVTEVVRTEALAGIAAVRATRQEDRFIQRTEAAIDQQNRAAYMNISIARWLKCVLHLWHARLS